MCNEAAGCILPTLSACTFICVHVYYGYLNVSPLSPWQREWAGFNKRVGVAQSHPVITVIVDWSGTLLCAAGNHAGQDLASEVYTPLIITPCFVLKHFACSFCTSTCLSLLSCCWWSSRLLSLPVVLPDASRYYCPYVRDFLPTA